MSRGGTVRLWLRPGMLGLHIFAVVVLVACVLAGLWQLGVYDSRQDHERAESHKVARVPLASVWSADQAFEGRLNHRPVTFEGHFAPAGEQVWVTGKRQSGRVGVWLLAPVFVGDSHDALLVVRGWAPSVTTPPAVPKGAITINAVLEAGDVGGASFDPTSRKIGSVRIPALTNELPFDLYSGYAISSTPLASAGLELATPPPIGVSWTVGLRNLAYALQWWVFGGFAIFMWWRIVTENVAASRPQVA
ncbi:MAG: SURF1-like protein [Aeromicrobium sp.]|nr:SURF1-like protein [Aeromicrobium sp.]